jgi:hypothetical protein
VLWCLSAYATCVLHQGGSWDIGEYHRYALAFLHTPLHRFPNEYPAPALAIFMMPLLLPIAYPWAFALLAGAVLIVLLVTLPSGDCAVFDVHAAKRLLAYSTVGGVMFFTARYDIFAVASAFWAVRAARRGRWSSAWTWSIVGVALKLFPAVFWPGFLIAEAKAVGRFPARRLLWIGGALALVVGLPMLFDPRAMLNVAHYYSRRPTEIGSLASGISLLVAPHSWKLAVSFLSTNTLSPVAAALSLPLSVLGAAGCIVAWWAQLRNRLPLEAVCLVTLTLVVLGMKVLSVQYLLWLMPLWALYRVRASWMVACVVTSAVFPYADWDTRYLFVQPHEFLISLGLLYFLRDVLVLVGTCLWLRSILGSEVHEPSVQPVCPSRTPGQASFRLRRRRPDAYRSPIAVDEAE